MTNDRKITWGLAKFTSNYGTLVPAAACPATSLPAGLSMDPDTGVVSGSTTFVGTSQAVCYRGTDSEDDAFAGSVLTIVSQPPLTLTGASPSESLNRNTAYSTTVTAANPSAGGVTWSTSRSLPPGVSAGFSGNVATLSGTPNTQGSWSYTLTARDADGTSTSKTIAFTVAAPACYTSSSTYGSISLRFNAPVQVSSISATWTWTRNQNGTWGIQLYDGAYRLQYQSPYQSGYSTGSGTASSSWNTGTNGPKASQFELELMSQISASNIAVSSVVPGFNGTPYPRCP
jgi:hypothetical protein